MNSFSDAPPLIRGEHLVAGTYVCGLANGGIEYGYSFHKPDPSDPTGEPMEDTEFDLVIGVVPANVRNSGPVIHAGCRKFRWAAEAIVKAAPKGGRDGSR